ncbi:MAG: metallophosphoesterase [Chloroflexaceae bacterium]|jgi:Icc-related predicted phosphoesterase|nr:metallophosphoesterase [Chloroflexaceae bacterium]
MRLAYTADLHGNILAYRQLLELALDQQARAVIVGGDLLPHTIQTQVAIGVQRRFILEQLRPLLAEYRAARPELAIYLLAGNDDWAGAIAALEELERDGLAVPIHGRVLPLGDNLWLAGYACVPVTPFSIKDYERRDTGDLPPYSFEMAYTSAGGEPVKTSAARMLALPTIAEELAALARQSNPARTIYVCHTPPHNTGLDQMRTKHVGSKALRAFIEQHQPPLTLHGHIHEAPTLSRRYAEQLGTTWSINPGHERTRFGAVVLDTDDIAGTMWHTIYGLATVSR